MKLHRSLPIALLTSALALPATGLGQSVSRAIIVGQSAPLTGSNRQLGEDIRNGTLACFKRVNDAGGVNGRKLELVTLDDGNDPKRAEANTRTLIEESRAVVLFGYASSTLSQPALPLIEAAKIGLVAPFTGSVSWRKFNRFVYLHRASVADELEKIVEHYTTFGIKRFAVLHYDDAAGKENLVAIEQALKMRGLELVAIASVQRKDVDMAPAVAKVLKATPDVVITTTLYKTSADFIKLARAQGTGAQFVSTSFAGSSALAAELGLAGVGVAMAQVVPPPTKASIPIVREYQGAIQNLLGRREYSFTSLEAYIAAKMLVEGIRRTGRDVSRDAVMRALDTLHDYDMNGYLITLSSTNHNGSKFVDLTILGGDLAFKN
jgi:ABC-type branched-subunit amino acid transport system substrate-binding protein